MTPEGFLRGAALSAVLLLAPGGGRRWMAASGLLLGFACFGLGPRALPAPGEAALQALALVAVAGVAFGSAWPTIVSRGAISTMALGLPAAVWAAFSLRGHPAAAIAPAVLGLLAAVSAFGAEGSRANTEAGWRRGALWAGATIAPVLLAAAVATAHARLGSRHALEVGVAALAAGLLVWTPAAVAEWRRAARELGEEVRLGLLPEEDARVLRSPFRRRAEKRFGRADERREYVSSALQLAVARQQQRRRSGEAERLRQLEILAFRTRIRRTLEARAARHGTSSSAEVPAAE